MFIYDSEFQPEQNLDHAKLVVEKLENFGYEFLKGENEVCFNHITGTGETSPKPLQMQPTQSLKLI